MTFNLRLVGGNGTMATSARARPARGLESILTRKRATTTKTAAISPKSPSSSALSPSASKTVVTSSASATDVAPTSPSSSPSSELSGLRHLGPGGVARATDPKANPFEKKKNAKSGAAMWTEVYELAELLKKKEKTFEELDLDDVDVRLKWIGLFHRRKRTPGKFMMRVRVPNGDVTSAQLRALGEAIAPYGDDVGCADVTTRAGIQLRGIPLEDADRVLELLKGAGMTPIQSGMDNVRQITGSPIAGVDPLELCDTRPFAHAVDAMITNDGKGNDELCNLPRKFNVSFSASRDDFVHSHINDLAFEACVDPTNGKKGWNVFVGGYLSMKRCAMSVPFDTFVPDDLVVDFVRAFLLWFRDNGERGDRQKARVMWLLERVGVDAARDAVAEIMVQRSNNELSSPFSLQRAVAVAHHSTRGGGAFERRDVLGIHAQRQPGFYWAGACVPVGRLFASDLEALARASEEYGDGTARFTVDENVVLPNVAAGKVEALLADPLFSKSKFYVPVTPDAVSATSGGGGGNGASSSGAPTSTPELSLATALVSCTGAQFCGLALAETKLPMLSVVRSLDEQLELTRPVRIHVTGCPNSCAQAQVGDIGLIGAPAKKEVVGPDGEKKKVAVQGFNIILGGTIGERAQLAATEFEKSVPVDEVEGKLKALLVERFGAIEK